MVVHEVLGYQKVALERAWTGLGGDLRGSWGGLGAWCPPRSVLERFLVDFVGLVGGQDGAMLGTCWLQDRILGVSRGS